MSRMFGERIYQFVLSSDIMDKELFHDILKLIESYITEELNVAYFSVLGKSKVDGQPGLKTLWSTEEDSPSYTIGRENEETNEIEYATYSGYVFNNNVPLWIVSSSQQPLEPNEEHIDLWSNTKNVSLSQNSAFTQENRKYYTAVIHPITVDGQPIGVVEFASEKYATPTHAALEEVRLLASVIARAYQMYDVRRLSRDNTKKAMQMLEASRKQESWAGFALPQIFVAYSGASESKGKPKGEHQKVIDSIKAVVNEFDDKLKIVFWEGIRESGDINFQVIDKIVKSDYGITYFSEPSRDGQWKYQDNPNVLFEAGMMQALKNAPGTQLKGWIPIREIDSPDIPFDIQSQRIVLVERGNKAGPLNKEKFSESLRTHIADLIGTEETGP